MQTKTRNSMETRWQKKNNKKTRKKKGKKEDDRNRQSCAFVSELNAKK